jgi:hypothetical protein
MTNQDRYLDALASKNTRHRVRGVYGRIVRTDMTDPQMLTEDPDRRVVMVMGPSGLQQLLGLSGCDALYKIGYSHEYIVRNLERGKSFKLVVFERPASLRIATWRVAIDVLAAHYPMLAPALRRALPALKSTPIEDFERQVGYTFYEARIKGSDDERFMTPARLLKSEQTPADVRRFLFHTVHFSELYTGDGYTLTPSGERGVREYMMPNARIPSLTNWRIADMSVELCAVR